MGIRCHCGWEGELADRVPATPEWLAENDVDPDHFTGNALNCPECGDSKGWTLTGEDAEDDAHELDDAESDGVDDGGVVVVRCDSCGQGWTESELSDEDGSGYDLWRCPGCHVINEPF